MLKCPNCGYENQEGSKFCVKCGNKLNANPNNDGGTNIPSFKGSKNDKNVDIPNFNKTESKEKFNIPKFNESKSEKEIKNKDRSQEINKAINASHNFFEFMQNSFLSIDRSFLFKSYFFATIMFLIWNTNNIPFIYLALCWVLYPFGDVVWNDFIVTITGGIVFVWPVVILIIWKVIKMSILFILSPILAPIGLLYLWIQRR